MSLDYINSKKIRKSFGKIHLVSNLPNLVEVQKKSFDNFLQLRVDPDKKENKTGGKPNYQKGRGGSGKPRGKRSNWKRGRKASRSNRKKFSKK